MAIAGFGVAQMELLLSEHLLYAQLFPHLIYKSGLDVPLLIDKGTTLKDTESSVQITDG